MNFVYNFLMDFFYRLLLLTLLFRINSSSNFLLRDYESAYQSCLELLLSSFLVLQDQQGLRYMPQCEKLNDQLVKLRIPIKFNYKMI